MYECQAVHDYGCLGLIYFLIRLIRAIRGTSITPWGCLEDKKADFYHEYHEYHE
jgi:hypothetical protein